MSSLTTMQAAVSSVNWALKPKPSRLKNAFDLSRFLTGRLTKILVAMFFLHRWASRLCWLIELRLHVGKLFRDFLNIRWKIRHLEHLSDFDRFVVRSRAA